MNQMVNLAAYLFLWYILTGAIRQTICCLIDPELTCIYFTFIIHRPVWGVRLIKAIRMLSLIFFKIQVSWLRPHFHLKQLPLS